METATVQELKSALQNLTAPELTAVCLRLARFKKENKELLHYLLLGSADQTAYLDEVKAEIREGIAEAHPTQLYFAKKTIRKVLRMVNRHIKYMASREAEAELLLYFCRALHDSGIRYREHAVLLRLYQTQLQKAEKAISGLHEDLQYDYRRQLLPLRATP